MAITENTFTGNGSNLGPFSFTFKWLESTDIKVEVAGSLKTAGTHYNLQALNYTTKNGGQVLFTAGNAPDNNAVIRIYRDTDDSALSATFFSGSAIRAKDLNDNFLQNLYISQETETNVANAVTGQIPNNSIGNAQLADGAVSDNKVTSIGSPKVTFTQSGIGAVQRTVESKLKDAVSVKDFGAVGDGTTDDTSAFQAALSTHLNVYVPAGTYVCSQLNLTTGQSLIGSGQFSTTIIHKSGSNSIGLFIDNVNRVVVSDLTIDGNSANNNLLSIGIRIAGASSNIKIINCRVTNCRLDGISCASTGSYIDIALCTADQNINDGITCQSTQHVSVTNCNLVNNGRFGVVLGAGCNYSKVGGCTIVGNSATNASGAGAAAVNCTDINFVGNNVYNNTLGHGLQFNTVTRGCMSGNVSRNNGISGLDSFSSKYISITGNSVYLNTVRGIEIDSAAYYNTCSSNVVSRNGGAGISVFRSPGTVVSSNIAIENGTALAEKAGIRLWDTADTLPSSNCLLLGNVCTDDRGASATQEYGISIEAPSTVNTVITNNKLSPNVLGPVSALSGTILRARDNTGFVTQNEGSSAIPNGSTSVTINHGLSMTPIARDFSIVLTSGPTSTVGEIWVNGITSTQFTVNCRLNPGSSGLNFLWRVSAY